jgi:hypothetical protein
MPKETGKPYKLKETKRAVSPSGRVTTTTKTIYAKPGDYAYGNGKWIIDKQPFAINFRIFYKKKTAKMEP